MQELKRRKEEAEQKAELDEIAEKQRQTEQEPKARSPVGA